MNITTHLEIIGLLPDSLFHQCDNTLNVTISNEYNKTSQNFSFLKSQIGKWYNKLVSDEKSKITFCFDLKVIFTNKRFHKKYNCIIGIDEDSYTAETLSYEGLSNKNPVEVIRVNPDVLKHGESYFTTIIGHELGHIFYKTIREDTSEDSGNYKYFHQIPKEKFADWFSLMTVGNLQNFQESTSIDIHNSNSDEKYSRSHQFDSLVNSNKELFHKFGLIA